MLCKVVRIEELIYYTLGSLLSIINPGVLEAYASLLVVSLKTCHPHSPPITEENLKVPRVVEIAFTVRGIKKR